MQCSGVHVNEVKLQITKSQYLCIVEISVHGYRRYINNVTRSWKIMKWNILEYVLEIISNLICTTDIQILSYRVVLEMDLSVMLVIYTTV